MKLSKMSITKNVLVNWYCSMKKRNWERFEQFLTTSMQVHARPKKILLDWLLALSIIEGPVKCATVQCATKDRVILRFLPFL